MFSMTPAAVTEILAAAARSSAAGMALRVAARQAADGSIEFGMGFDEEREDDEKTRFDELEVLIGAPSQPLLDGAVLDFAEAAPGQLDFVFIPAPDAVVAGGTSQPKPKGACGSGGCGSCGT
jgi:iron-sulfur cluster assembly protein